MPLTNAKCTNCGGSLQVDSTKKAAICPFCNEAYIVEEAINNYNISIDTINVNDDRAAKSRIEAGEAFLKLKQWDKADEAFIDACDLTPQNYLGWWGRIRALSGEFSLYVDELDAKKDSIAFRRSKKEQMESLYSSLDVFIPDDKKESIYKEFNKYIKIVNSTIEKAIDKNKACNDVLNRSIEEAEAKLNETEEKKKQYSRNYQRTDRVHALRSRGLGTFTTFVFIGSIIALFISKSAIPAIILGALVFSFILAKILDNNSKHSNQVNQEKEGECNKQLSFIRDDLKTKQVAKEILNHESVLRSSHKNESYIKPAAELLQKIIESVK